MKITYTYGKQSVSWRDIWTVLKVLRSPWLTQGPKVREFEQQICDYTGAKYAVAVSNGTAALHLAMLAQKINTGDEVVTSPITFLASTNAILYVGGVVKFADIDPKTACIDPHEIEKNITDKTKGIIPVHYAGQSCDMEVIYSIAKKHNLFIIEDAAHAIGSDYKGSKVGSCKYSDMAIFSFHPVKTITTGEGGAITTNNKELYERLCMLRSHGLTKDPAHLLKNDGPWYYEMHELGFNYRLSDIHAALGISQFKRLDGFVDRRRSIVERYQNALKGDDRFSFLIEREHSRSSYHILSLIINFDVVKTSKKELFERLRSEGLLLQVHYIPVYLQPFYKRLGFEVGCCPNSEDFYKSELSIPNYPQLSNKDVDRIISIIKRVIC